MPEPYGLSRVPCNGETVVFRGPYVVGRYEDDDVALRNLVIVSLRDAGHSGLEVAGCFGFSEEHVARLHTRARREGSDGLARKLGRPRKLTKARAARARAWSDQGLPNAEIARRLGVHRGTIGRLLGRKGGGEARLQELDLGGAEQTTSEDDASHGGCDGDEGDGYEDEGDDEEEEAGSGSSSEPAGPLPVPAPCSTALVPVSGRAGEGKVQSRYAGAMLLHPFLCSLGVQEVLSGLSREAARRYDAASLLLGAVFGFVLGVSSLEGAKHLRSADAGALVGLSSFPHLRTLRPALKSLAPSCDPLALQRAFAKAMVAADDHPPELFYVDDHFVTYWGSRPVAKGYNVRRHLAEPGRDDTFVVDERWRAVCFSSGEPRGLSVSMGEVVGQLKEVTGGRAAMVGFDRGGSYPKVFTELKAAGMDWVTWRRAPLVAPTAEPRRSWVVRDGKRRYLMVADEEVTLDGYDKGPVRQLSSFEDGRLVFQILTSNTTFRPGPVVAKLRGRWCIENFNKYVEDHHGVHWLASYEMETEVNTALVKNPLRADKAKELKQADAALSEAERSLGATLDRQYASAGEHAAETVAARDRVAHAKDAVSAAKAALKGLPAKVPANELDKNAKRAKPRLAARALQMVCRLLAYNAELDLARRLNAYLDDEDEYRAITRNLLHLGGTIAYGKRDITVSLDRPGSPRVERALRELVAELNDGPAVYLAGDRRPITYQVSEL